MENDERPKTISVPEAGRRYFDLARNAAYEAARRGDLPVIRIGGRLRVPVVALERMLAEAGTDKAATVIRAADVGSAPKSARQVRDETAQQHRPHRAL